MANVFKNKHKRKLPATNTSFYTVPSATTTVLLGLSICNIGSTAETVDVFLDDAGGGLDADFAYLVKDLDVPANSTIEIFAGQKYVLETTDELFLKASTEDKLDIFMGIMEMT